MSKDKKAYYFDYAIYWDFLIVVGVATSMFLCKRVLEGSFELATMGSLSVFRVSLITVSASLIGFFLTITTVIVTFKKGFETSNINPSSTDTIETTAKTTIFENKISKQKQFYKSPIHKSVVNVFVKATYEIGFALFALLAMQLNIIEFSVHCSLVLSISILILILLSTIRCLYIFKLFLKVHLN
jgi:hypothetical protein